MLGSWAAQAAFVLLVYVACLCQFTYFLCELLPLKIAVWTERRQGSRRERNEQRNEGSFVINQHEHIQYFVMLVVQRK